MIGKPATSPARLTSIGLCDSPSHTTQGTRSVPARNNVSTGLVEERVPQPDRDHRPGIGAEKSSPRRQVVAVLARKRNRSHGGVVRYRQRLGAEPFFDSFDSTQRPAAIRDRGAFRPGVQPGADVAPARHRGEIVDVPQQAQLRQALKDAEVERRAADATAGKGEPEQVHLGSGGQRMTGVGRDNAMESPPPRLAESRAAQRQAPLRTERPLRRLRRGAAPGWDLSAAPRAAAAGSPHGSGSPPSGS